MTAVTQLVDTFRGNAGIRLALDDVGGSKNLFSFDLLENVQVIKFDGGWLERLKNSADYRPLLEGLLKFSHLRGIQSVLEGVETPEHFRLAQELGVDMVQGFLFKDSFLTQEGPAPKLPGPLI